MKYKLTDLNTHFEFGRNWQNYVELIDDEDIRRGIKSLTRLLPAEELEGKSFLDIGSGSGMTILSALNFGTSSCKGFDIDPNSVSAARALLGKHAKGQNWKIDQGSVLELSPDQTGLFDIVHSWGVLHHTGDMWRAIEAASKFTKPGGMFALAIYRKTPFCKLWAVEKYLYSRSPRFIQKTLRGFYKLFYFAGLLATGRSPAVYQSDYNQDRGMDWNIDVHDWMGGYPYEAASANELTDFVCSLGFRSVRNVTHIPALAGIFGTHCDEFVFEKNLNRGP
jgi:SAM-dependent methyltransferase